MECSRAARKLEGIRAGLRRLSERGNLVKLNHSGKRISSMAFMRMGFAVSVRWQCNPANSHSRNCSGCSFSLTKYDARERLHADAAWSYVRPEALRAAAKLFVKVNHLPISSGEITIAYGLVILNNNLEIFSQCVVKWSCNLVVVNGAKMGIAENIDAVLDTMRETFAL